MAAIVIVGGGGHAKVLIDLIRAARVYEIAGVLDARLDVGAKVLGVPVLGGDALLPELYSRGMRSACIAVGSIGDNSRRKSLFDMVKGAGFGVPVLIHPASMVSPHAALAEGAQIMAGAVLQAECRIGENTIINTGALVEHDCSVGRDVHICPGAVVSGGCEIGDGSFIGAGAVIIQGVKIGKNSVVAAGSVVVGSVPGGATVKGVPAK